MIGVSHHQGHPNLALRQANPTAKRENASGSGAADRRRFLLGFRTCDDLNVYLRTALPCSNTFVSFDAIEPDSQVHLLSLVYFDGQS
jgi:hypothetical protein